MTFQKGHPHYGRKNVLTKKALEKQAAMEPLHCLFCESTNVDGARGECLDCGTASAEMLTKMWTGKFRMRPLSRTMSAQGAVYAQHVNYSGPNRFSGG
jgi:hypothetical protein